MLASELAARHRRGERPDPSEYRGRFHVSGDSAVIKAAFDAIPIRPAVDFAGSEQGDATENGGSRDQPIVRPLEYDEATHDAVDRGGATCAGDSSTHAASYIVPGNHAGPEIDRTAADFSCAVPSADFVMATSDGHASLPAARGPQPTLPGYEILGELGRGGMGVVYHARQVRLNRAVALKMILAGQHAGAESGARFLAEAEAVAKLQHPNIVQIFHIDEHAGYPYFEMEYVGGGSLADRLDGTPRPPREAARLVETLAGAMAEAHRQGVVHRDLKPGNILLTLEGMPKVADFGLAKLLNVESGLTRTDSILGSPSYMAPEQAEGKTRDVGPAADLYALGAILYELLTGRPPFRGATVLETLQQVKTAEPVPPSRLVPGMPRDAETVALKCLQKDPAKRYGSAAALAEDLRRYQAGKPIVAQAGGLAGAGLAMVQAEPGAGELDGCRGHAVAGPGSRCDDLGLAIPLHVTVAGIQPLLQRHHPGPPRVVGRQPGASPKAARRLPAGSAPVGMVLPQAALQSRTSDHPGNGRGQRRGVQPRRRTDCRSKRGRECAGPGRQDREGGPVASRPPKTRLRRGVQPRWPSPRHGKRGPNDPTLEPGLSDGPGGGLPPWRANGRGSGVGLLRGI